MIISQLPSLEEIYDYSSQDLQKMVSQFNHRIATTSLTKQQQQGYQDFIENIHIELEQRKTLEFFQQLCQIENPYLKKVTDFNNQFLKLASQALAAQDYNAEVTQYGKKKLKLLQIQEQNQQQQVQQGNNDGSSVTSMNKINQRLNTNNGKFHPVNQDKAYSVTSQNNSTSSHEIKMGLRSNNNKHKMKNSMKDFILTTLNKNKNDGCYVVKKSGNAPNKPVPTFTVNQRGHLVNPNSLQPIGIVKSIKSSSKSRQSNQSEMNQKTTSSKNIAVDNKQMQAKRQQAFKKVNHIKAQKNKQKHLNNKDLVEMIREQQKSKQNKLIKQKLNQKNIQVINNQLSMQKQLKDASSDLNNKQIHKVQLKIDNDNKIKQYSQTTVHQNCMQLQEVRPKFIEQQSNKDIKLSNIKGNEGQKKQSIYHQGISKSIDNEQICQMIQVQANDRQIKSIQIIEQIKQNIVQQIKINEEDQDQNTILNDNKIKQRKIQQNLDKYDHQMQELIKIQEQIAHQNTLSKQLSQNVSQKDKSKQPKQNQLFGVIINVQTAFTEQKQTQIKQNVNKKCYNEDYWIHIRQQAEQQIKRFKETKQIQQLSKKNVKEQIDKSMQKMEQKQMKRLSDEMFSKESQNNQYLSEDKVQQQNEQDVFIQRKKKQLAKMVNDHNKRKTTKKISSVIVNPPKPLYALPTFNYLEIYPTFNHIFSVMYTKSQHQAIMDVPLIMRDLINMFTTHIHHFKDKTSYFKPAIFLPFDTANSLQMTDPRQLLLHAENTHVNLKKIVQRLQTFNENLHGQFNSNNTRYYRVIKTKEQVYDIISTGFLRRKGWKQLPHGCSLRSSWNLFWSWAKPDIDISKILVWQRINHFPFNKNLSRKDLLYKNLDSFRKMLKVPFDFLPLTYNLPKQFTQFSIKFHEQQLVNRDRNYWIMKPIGKSRGRGIKVINNLAELNYTDNIVVQKYIANPLLLDGYKFDMRIYVLVTNFHPLEAFVYKEGFARLSTQKFNLEPAFMKNAFIHLTNFAINKNNEEAKQNAVFSGGSKISLKVLKQKLGKMNYSFGKIWSQVNEIIIKSLLGCSISVPTFPGAFQLFGYDIMIDTQGGCHLIQINASPSLQRSYLIDQIIKQSLIDDILDIVDPPDFDKQQLLDIMSERLLNKKKITPEQDLISIARVLKYQKLRKIGQLPENIGLFQMIAPSKMSTDLQKQIKGRSGANNPKNID